MGFESYWETGAGAQVIHAFDDPLNLFGLPWTGILGANYRYRDYNRPNFAIDLDEEQRDHRVDLNLTLDIPVHRNVAAFLRSGYALNTSTYAIEEFTNLSIMSGLRARF